MKNFILCLVACCTFLMCGMEVDAAREPYYVDYAEPQYGENSGYVIFEYASGKVGTFFWSAYCESDYVNDVESVNTGMSIVIDEQRVIFNILTDKNIDADITNVSTYYTFSNFSSSGNYYHIKSGTVVDSNPTYTYTTSSTIVGYTYKGNVSMVTTQLEDEANTAPVVIFGDDIVGQYVHELYELIGLDSNLLQTYLPKLNKIEAWESRNNEHLETLVTLTTDILNAIDTNNSSSVQYLEHLSNINDYLSSIDVDVGLMKNALNSLLTVTNSIAEVIEDMYSSVDNIDATTLEMLEALQGIRENVAFIEFDVNTIDDNTAIIKNKIDNINNLLTEYIPYLVSISSHLAYIEFDVDQIDNNVAYIKNKVDVIIEMLGTMSDADQQVSDKFQEDSSSQTESLNDLNEQAQLNKPNVDDMSNTVDEHLDVDIDANYGLLLSTFTLNNRVLTMLLIVASISLISFVFFGKR